MRKACGLAFLVGLGLSPGSFGVFVRFLNFEFRVQCAEFRLYQAWSGYSPSRLKPYVKPQDLPRAIAVLFDASGSQDWGLKVLSCSDLS